MELAIGSVIVLIYGLAVLACVLGVLTWLRRRHAEWPMKVGGVVAVLVIAYAIPFGDHTLGLIKFHRLCDEQAGVKILETVKGVDGFMWETGRETYPHTFGYSFYEAKTNDKGIFRYGYREDGSVFEEKVGEPRAKYLVRRNRDLQLDTNYKKSEFVILELGTGNTIASHGIVHYSGGWLIREMRGIGVGGSVCPKEPFNSLEFIHSVLKPSVRRGTTP